MSNPSAPTGYARAWGYRWVHGLNEHPDATDAAVRVGLVLWKHADNKTGHSHPGRALIARQAGNMHPSTVSAACTSLIEIGALRLVKRGGTGFHSAYQLVPYEDWTMSPQRDMVAVSQTPSTMSPHGDMEAVGPCRPTATWSTLNHVAQNPQPCRPRATPTTLNYDKASPVNAIKGNASVPDFELELVPEDDASDELADVDESADGGTLDASIFPALPDADEADELLARLRAG